MEGTFSLRLFAGHFMRNRLGQPLVKAACFSCSLAAIKQTLAQEMHEGRIVITEWTYDESLTLSFGVFIIGGRNANEGQGAAHAGAIPRGAEPGYGGGMLVGGMRNLDFRPLTFRPNNTKEIEI